MTASQDRNVGKISSGMRSGGMVVPANPPACAVPFARQTRPGLINAHCPAPALRPKTKE